MKATLAVLALCACVAPPVVDAGALVVGPRLDVVSASAVASLGDDFPSGDAFVVVQATVTNPDDGAPLPVDRARWALETDDGLLHDPSARDLAIASPCPATALLAEGATFQCTNAFEPPSGNAVAALRFFLDEHGADALRVPLDVTIEPLTCAERLFDQCDVDEEDAYGACVTDQCEGLLQAVQDCCDAAGHDFLTECVQTEDGCACADDLCGCASSAVPWRACNNECATTHCL